MSRRGPRLLLAIAGILIVIPGLRLLFDSTGYANGKANLPVSPDLYNELGALGAIFVAAGVTLLAGAISTRLHVPATIVGVVALLPQGVARVISYATQDGQHDSYLRAGIIELIVGTALALLLTKQLLTNAEQT